MLESIAEIGTMMQQAAGLPGVEVDQVQVAQTITILNLMTNSNPAEGKSVPMLSEPIGSDDVTVLFMAYDGNILVARDDFDGEMTLVGKVAKKIPVGKSIDLIDELKIMPRSLRRMRSVSGGPKEAIVSMLGTLPESLGGPVPPEALMLSGPAVVISPLAVFN